MWIADRPSTCLLKAKPVNRSDMDFIKCSQSLACSRSSSSDSFSIKNILNLRDERDIVELPRFSSEGLKNAKCSMTKPMVAPTPYSVSSPPLMYPCACLGLPLYGPLNWPTGLDIPSLISNSRFTPGHEFFASFAPYTNLRRRRRLSRKKKQRPLFSQQQVQTMEDEFTKHRYINESKRAELSSELGLTETQVKTWFQNRRTKWRKEIKEEVATTVAQANKYEITRNFVR